jgi:transcriptional antiterminator
MLKYKVIKNGVETNSWTSESGLDETHYEPGFGAMAWTQEILDEEGNVVETIEHPAEFTIEIEDISQQHALQQAKAQLMAHRSFGQSLVADFAVENAILGITAEQSDYVIERLQGVLTALSNGYLETAIKRAKDIEDFDEIFITEVRLLSYVHKIEAYLGLELSESL